MSVMRYYYNPLAQLNRLFDDAFIVRFQPITSADIGRAGLFRPR